MKQQVAVVIIVLFLMSCSQSDDSSNQKTVDITLAAEMSLLPATVWIAENKGFFKKHNINLIVKEFDSGRNALETMLRDDTIDIATVAQTPIVFNTFKKEPYVIVATMAYSIDDIKVLARKDRGIVTPEDLAGKKIGATKRSTGHYFLEGFLTHYGYTLEDVDLHDVNAATLKEKLESGELDAITSWEPHIFNTKKSFGEDKLTLFVSPTPFRKDFYFAVGREYALNNSEHLKRFLATVVEAEEYIKNNQTESQAIVSQRLKVDPEIVKKIWDSFIFEITLDQSILVSLEDEAIWAMRLMNHSEESLPNYLDYIDIAPLLSIKPHGVQIIY